MPAFKIGDVVQLKSGGPEMTVEDIGDYGKGAGKGVSCVWFDNRKRCTDTFHVDTLEPADRQPMDLEPG